MLVLTPKRVESTDGPTSHTSRRMVGGSSQWQKASQPATENYKTTTSFRRGDTVFPAIMYATNAVSLDGRSDISYSLFFRRPDGSIHERIENLTVVKGVPPTGPALSEKKMGLKIKETDPFGEYMVKVTVTDNMRQVPVEMVFNFTVIDPTSFRQPSLLSAPATSGSPLPPEDPIGPDAASPTAPAAPPAASRVRSIKN